MVEKVPPVLVSCTKDMNGDTMSTDKSAAADVQASCAPVEIFVPGRVCLLGEHTDWAGSHRRFNAEIQKGCNIVCGTEQGLHARVRPHPSKLVVSSISESGEKKGPVEFDMDRATLLKGTPPYPQPDGMCWGAASLFENRVADTSWCMTRTYRGESRKVLELCLRCSLPHPDRLSCGRPSC